MTTAALRLRMRRMTSEAEEAEAEGGELNLVPFLDILTNMLLFLIATVSFSAAVAEVPARAASSARTDKTAVAAPAYRLGVHIGADRLVVEARGETEEPLAAEVVLPFVAGGPDYQALNRVAAERKRLHPEGRMVEVSAEPGVAYERVVGVMDAVHGAADQVLFPEPVLR